LQDVSFAFLSIILEGAPFILLGTLLSGFIDVYLPSGAMDRLLPRRKNVAVMVAGLLGVVFPVCECAVVPVIRRLVRKGLPVSCAFTYMLAAPIVNPVTALSTWKAFTGQGAGMMVSSRLLLGYAVAVLVGLVVARMPLERVLRRGLAKELANPPSPRLRRTGGGHEHADCGHEHEGHEHGHGHEGCGHGHDGHAGCGEEGAPAAPVSDAHGAPLQGARVLAAFRSALRDFVDVAVYFVIGVAITALFNTGIAPGAASIDALAEHPAGAPAALMVMAFVLSLCSTSDAFIAATLDRFGYGAKLAFLCFGPMMDLKLVFLYQTVMSRRFIVGLAVALFVVIGGVAVFWQQLLERMS